MKKNHIFFIQITLIFGILLCSPSAFAKVSPQLVKDIQKGNLAGVKQAIESGISPNSKAGRFKEALLNLAANHGQLKVVKYLISKGAQVNKVTGVFGGMTPLIRASGICNHKIVKFLLQSGADPNLTNNGTYYTSPLASAASNGRTKCSDTIKILVAHKADPNFVKGSYKGKGKGHSVLNLSIMSATQPDLAILLIKLGADVNQIANGSAPLQEAIKSFPLISNYSPKRDNAKAEKFIQLVKLLLEKGANPNIKTSKGKSPETLIAEKFSQTGKGYYIEVTDNLHADISGKKREPSSPRDRFYQQKKRELLALLKQYQ